MVASAEIQRFVCTYRQLTQLGLVCQVIAPSRILRRPA